LVVVEAALKDVILDIEVVVEVVVKVVGVGAGAAIPAVVSIGLPFISSLPSPIKKGAYIKNRLIISIRL